MFQSNAFQSFAFQTVGARPSVIGGHFIPTHHGSKRKTLSNILIIYEKAKELPRKETKELRDILSEFVAPEIARKAMVPTMEQVDYTALEANDLAYKKFESALESIENLLSKMAENDSALRKEDDELLLMSIIACSIH